MKRYIAVVFILFLMLPSCGTSTSTESNELQGKYCISKMIYNGFSSYPDSFEGSNITADTIGDNTVATLTMFWGNDDIDVTMGYISKVQETGSEIIYKFWITGHSGSFSTQDTGWFYLYYDTVEDSIEIDIGDDCSFVFTK